MLFSYDPQCSLAVHLAELTLLHMVQIFFLSQSTPLPLPNHQGKEGHIPRFYGALSMQLQLKAYSYTFNLLL